MNFDFLNSIPDSEWTLGVDGHLRKAFPIVELCRALGIEPSPGWQARFDFLGHAQPRCYRQWPCSIPWHTELSCLPSDKAGSPLVRTGMC